MLELSLQSLQALPWVYLFIEYLMVYNKDMNKLLDTDDTKNVFLNKAGNF